MNWTDRADERRKIPLAVGGRAAEGAPSEERPESFGRAAGWPGDALASPKGFAARMRRFSERTFLRR